MLTDDQIRAIPESLRHRPQWLVWRFESKPGAKKPAKVPYYAGGGRRQGVQGSDTDRAALVTCDAAVAAAHLQEMDGIGFAFLPGDGLIGIDLDAVIDAESGEISERASKIVEACASYTELSPSGRGLHIIVQGEIPDSFKSNDIGVEVFCGRQFFTFTGRVWPGTVADVRAVDEMVLRRLRATVEAAKGRGKASTPSAVPAAGSQRAKVESALAFISADVGYNDWIAVGMSIRAELGEGGLDVWDRWSSRGQKYPGTKILAQHWRSFPDGAHEGPLYRMATDAGWRAPRQPQRGKERSSVSGSPPPDAPPVRDVEPENDESWRDLLLRRGEERRLVDCRENVFLFLEHHPDWKGVIRLDEFANKVVKLRPPPFEGGVIGEWDRADAFRLGMWLAQHERLLIRSMDSITQAVNASATMHPHHPVRSWMDGLVWDGTPRLDMWIEDALGSDPAKRMYHALAGRYWMLGMVARIYEPGCIMRSMLIIEGAQQRGKSTALAILGGEWYSETPFVIGDKDAYQSLRGKMLYEIAELDAFNRAESTKVKAFVSSRVDNYRASYDDRSRDWPRQVVFAGTTNQDEYFKDSTGNTRFWPVRVGDLDLDVLRSNRDQLFAEAVARYKAGERRYPTPEEEREYFRPEQDAREIADPWESMISTWLHSSTCSTVTQVEIFEYLDIKPDRIDNARAMSTRIGNVMKRIGWPKDRRKTGAREYYYKRPAAAGQPAESDDDQPF